MTKFFIIWCISFILFGMCLSCSDYNNSQNSNIAQTTNCTVDSVKTNCYFEEVYRSPQETHYVVYDKETKVMYVVSNGVYNRGTFTMLVDSLGNPKLYKK